MQASRRRPRTTAVLEKTALCLSCPHAIVRVENEFDLKIRCRLGHRSAVACPDWQDDGRLELLHAIVRHMRRTQTGYRKVFNVVEPDCPSCTSNCCTRPNLQRTPFYGEDAIYYLLIGQPLPDPSTRDADHCVYFDRGCTLSAHLRPHVCIEYTCPFVPTPPRIDELGRHMKQDTIYLIAVATREHEEWRGADPEIDARTNRPTGRAVDRFGNVWNPARPLDDLRARYLAVGAGSSAKAAGDASARTDGGAPSTAGEAGRP